MATKKRVLEDLRITAIAAVDRPAQAGALVSILKSADEVPTKKRQTRLTNIKLDELSFVTAPACPGAVVSIIKREDPQPAQPFSKGNAADQQTALDAMQRLLDKVQKAASGPEAMTLDEALAKISPVRKGSAEDELQRLAEQHSDRTGMSHADAYNHIAATEPELFKRAVDGGDL